MLNDIFSQLVWHWRPGSFVIYSTSGNLWQFSSMPFFIVHIYLCLQCLIPYLSSPIICYPVDANLHYVFNHCCVCSSFFRWPPCQRSDMILMKVSQSAYDMIHYISRLFGYLYVCKIYVNLIWYLYLFMLNKFCLSLSLSLRRKTDQILNVNNSNFDIIT